MRRAVRSLSLVLALVSAAPVAAQQGTGASRNALTSPLLIIDSDRVYQESAFGRRVAMEEGRRLSKLEAENREIEAALEAEERRLTDRRAEMTPEAFRALADAFDRKVQETRATQETKFRAINTGLDRERTVFQQAAAPVFEQLMREAGAAVILERRSVFASATVIEITEEAIALLDSTLGDGSAPQEP